MFDFPFGFICLHLSAAIGSHSAFLCVSRYLSNIWDLSCWKLLSPITIFLIKRIELLLVPCSKAFSPLYLVVFVILSSTISKCFLATFEKCICESCYQHTSIGFTQAVWSYKAHSPSLCMRLKAVLDTTDYNFLWELTVSYFFIRKWLLFVCVLCFLFLFSRHRDSLTLPCSFPPTAGM